MAAFDESQADSTQAMMFNGGHMPLDVAALKLTAGPANVYRFDQTFVFWWNGQLPTFKQHCTYALDAELKAALIAAAAPMTQL
jgi:hypothetical protein